MRWQCGICACRCRQLGSSPPAARTLRHFIVPPSPYGAVKTPALYSAGECFGRVLYSTKYIIGTWFFVPLYLLTTLFVIYETL